MGNASSQLVAHQELLTTFSSATSVPVGDPFWRGLLNFNAALTRLDPVVLQQSLADTLDQLGSWQLSDTDKKSDNSLPCAICSAVLRMAPMFAHSSVSLHGQLRERSVVIAAANNGHTLHFQKLLVHVLQLVKGVGKADQRAPQASTAHCTCVTSAARLW